MNHSSPVPSLKMNSGCGWMEEYNLSMDAILSFPFQIIQRGKVVMGVFKSLFISLPIYIRDQKISQRESYGFPDVIWDRGQSDLFQILFLPGSLFASGW